MGFWGREDARPYLLNRIYEELEAIDETQHQRSTYLILLCF